MNVVIGEKVILTQPVDKLKNVGEVFEIANVVENFVVLRHERTKMAVGVCNITDMDAHFEKYEHFNNRKWTPWTRLLNCREEVIGFYRTNGKKVQVRTLHDNYRGEATCNKTDTFNVWFGINLAWERMHSKIIADYKKNVEKAMKHIKEEEHNNKNKIKRLINSLEPTQTNESVAE